jgi:hypothetical protein
VDEGVLLAYVTNSASLFNVTADQIIYWKNLGVSPRVINAMMQHDQELLSGARPVIMVASPPAAPPPGVAQIVANEDSQPSEPLVPDDYYYAPEQPASAGPVRVPYPVKLNDPIIVLKLPSFTVPYW